KVIAYQSRPLLSRRPRGSPRDGHVTSISRRTGASRCGRGHTEEGASTLLGSMLIDGPHQGRADAGRSHGALDRAELPEPSGGQRDQGNGSAGVGWLQRGSAKVQASAADGSKAAAPRPVRLVAGAGLVVKSDLGDAAFAQRAAGGPMGHLETIEADAPHERDQVGEHVAHGTQLTLVGILVAQQSRGREGAAVGKCGKGEGDQRKPRQVCGEIVYALAGFEAQTKRRVAAHQRRARGKRWEP